MKPQPRKQQVSLLLKGDYEIGIDGWSPDFADPITFLELFTTNNPYNLDHYSNKEFDETIEKVKTTLAGDEKARWEALLASEKILFKDSVIAPFTKRRILFRTFLCERNCASRLCRPIKLQMGTN